MPLTRNPAVVAASGTLFIGVAVGLRFASDAWLPAMAIFGPLMLALALIDVWRARPKRGVPA